MPMKYRRILAPLAMLGLFLFAAGCSDADEPDRQDAGSGDTIGDAADRSPGTSRGSCTYAAGCVDYIGSFWTQSAQESNCREIPDSTWSIAACPTQDLVGSCGTNLDGPGGFITRYYAPLFTASMAENQCNISEGTWIP
ncbi:MAG: hypothetical protein JW797_09875 [Bradymonadales bacterium]|nr:hypothetical protein [Bradymonadales bacterium]